MYAGGGRLVDILGTRMGFLLIMAWWSLACASHGLAAGFATLADLVTGGEDYEVLAAIAPQQAGKFEAAAAAAGTPVTRIGFIDEAVHGVRVRDGSGRAMAFTRTGWDHFSD